MNAPEDARIRRDAVDIVVLHDNYGCETGCCGHSAIVRDKNQNSLDNRAFSFDHWDPVQMTRQEFIDEVAEAVLSEYRRLPVAYDDCILHTWSDNC